MTTVREKLLRFVNRAKTEAISDTIFDSGSLECFCPLCESLVLIDTFVGLPVCNECGWVHFRYLDSTPDWKHIKAQQEDSAAMSVIQLHARGRVSSALQAFYGAGSSNVKAVSPNTIASVALSSFIEKKKLPEKAISATAASDGRPPRRKKVRFNEPASAAASADAEETFKPSINSRTFFEHCQHMYQVAAERRIGKIMIERAIWWYKELLQFYKFHGFVCDALKAASVYMSAVEMKIPLTQKDCAEMFAVSKSYTTKCINIMEKHRTSIMMKSTYNKPVDYVRLFFSKLRAHNPEISFPVERMVLCFFVAERLEKLQLAMDNYPHCVAATILFMVMESSAAAAPSAALSWKKSICALTQTSEVTLNRCFNKLVAYKEELFPSNAGIV